MLNIKVQFLVLSNVYHLNHLFVLGEVKNGEVSGYHNWFR